jgi:hypothetical protein
MASISEPKRKNRAVSDAVFSLPAAPGTAGAPVAATIAGVCQALFTLAA